VSPELIDGFAFGRHTDHNDVRGSTLGHPVYGVANVVGVIDPQPGSWLSQFRRLRVRYDKRADIHEAFLSLGCALICWQSLRRTWRTA
jgi:hypothetical protein